MKLNKTLMNQLVPLLLVLMGNWGVSMAATSGKEANTSSQSKLKVVNKKPDVDPFVDMMIGEKHVTSTCYDRKLNSTLYPADQKKFDIKISDVIADFGYNIANDYVGKGGYLMLVGPKYVGKLTNLISKHLGEWYRLKRKHTKSGFKLKEGYLSNIIGIWKDLKENWAKNPANRAKLMGKVPKNAELFMKEISEFLEYYKAFVKYNRYGVYVDWAQAKFDEKPLAEVGAPFVIYLQENGHGAAVVVLDSLVSIFSLMEL